jgi:hypothetical protein
MHMMSGRHRPVPSNCCILLPHSCSSTSHVSARISRPGVVRAICWSHRQQNFSEKWYARADFLERERHLGNISNLFEVEPDTPTRQFSRASHSRIRRTASGVPLLALLEPPKLPQELAQERLSEWSIWSDLAEKLIEERFRNGCSGKGDLDCSKGGNSVLTPQDGFSYWFCLSSLLVTWVNWLIKFTGTWKFPGTSSQPPLVKLQCKRDERTRRRRAGHRASSRLLSFGSNT